MINEVKKIGLNILEKEYRELNDVSYSFLSKLDREGPKNIKNKIDPTEPMIFGTMVDEMMDGSFKRDNYYISEGNEIGEKIKPAIDLLLNIIRGNQSSNLNSFQAELVGILQTNNIDYHVKRTALSRASSIIKDKNASAYFKAMIESKGKIIITQSMYDDAQLCRNILKTHKFTKHLFGKVKNEEGFYQVKYKWEENGIGFKGMLDRLIINHENKTIKPFDLKTGGKNALNFQESFYKYRYDIQGVMYYIICKKIRDQHYPGYTIDNFKFIYIGRYEKQPLVWEMPKKHMELTVKGYERHGRKVKGIKELLMEYKWHSKNNFKLIFSENVYKNNGIIKIPMIGINELKNDKYKEN